MNQLISSIENIAVESEELLQSYQNQIFKTQLNAKSSLLLKAGQEVICCYVFPFLDFTDLINLRSTCKELNSQVCSIMTLTNMYKLCRTIKLCQKSEPKTELLQQVEVVESTVSDSKFIM